MAVGGDAVARDDDGRVVFVAGALPGEQVVAEVTEERRDFARAVTVEVLHAAAERREPPCPHVADGCGGCDWQHVVPPAQAELKRAMVAETLHRFGGVAEPVVELGPPLEPGGGRTTVRAAVTNGRAGYRRRRSHDVLAVDECLISHPLVAEMLVDGWFAGATEVTLRAGARTGERLAIVTPTAQGVRLPADVVVVGSDELRRGHRAWYHEEVAGRRWRISATSFFQARPDGADALVSLVGQAVEGLVPNAERLVDLCSGVGLFAGSLAGTAAGASSDTPRSVLAVERHRPAVVDAGYNLAGLDARVVRSSIEAWRPSTAEVVVADPPRRGLGKPGVAAVAATGAAACILVSCDPAALGRDVALIAGCGLHHVRSTLVDLFPNTSHVEVVTALVRRKESIARHG